MCVPADECWGEVWGVLLLCMCDSRASFLYVSSPHSCPILALHKQVQRRPVRYSSSIIFELGYLERTVKDYINWSDCLIQRVLNKFTESQAFSRSYGLAPRPPTPPPLPSVSSNGDTQEDWERETTCWGERVEGGGRGAKSYDRKESWSSTNFLILSGIR